MRTLRWGLVVASVLGFVAAPVSAQISIAATETAYTQDFNTLAATGTSMTVPAGWAFIEAGTGSNATYAAGTGSASAADTYSLGATSATDRALGSLRTNAFTDSYGAQFANGTGAAVASITISYHGEQWRVGDVTGRTDQLDFQYSLNATGIDDNGATTTWVDVDALDFVGPEHPTSGTVGLRVGNAAANSAIVSSTFTLALPAAATVWIRWNDANAANNDDALAVDDFSLTAHGATAATGAVTYDVFFDANGNGTLDTGETGIAGWGVALDGGASQLTATDGTTTFASVTTGVAHTVMNTPPASASTWHFTFPTTITTSGSTTVVHVAVTCTCPDDGTTCTALPVCTAGVCGATPAVDCDDHNLCTDDSCGGAACTNANNTLACDDSSLTTRNDVCGGGTCAGTAYSCTPGVCEASSVANGTDCTITFASAATACGSASSIGCDAPDHCMGGAAVCVAAVQGLGFTCRPSTESCDTAEMCDGATAVCPADVTTCTDAGPAVDDAGTDAAVVADDAGTDAAVVVDDAGTDAGMDAGAADDAAVTHDAATLTDTGVHDAGRDSGAHDGSTVDGAAHPDAATVTPPPSANCSCRTSGGSAPSAMWLGLIGVGLLLRSRRRSR